MNITIKPFWDKFNTLIKDPIQKHDISDEAWFYWFEGDGIAIFSYVPYSELWNIGDTISVNYFSVLFNKGLFKRNFEEDFKTISIRITSKEFFYDNVDYQGNEEVEANFSEETTPALLFEFDLVKD